MMQLFAILFLVASVFAAPTPIRVVNSTSGQVIPIFGERPRNSAVVSTNIRNMQSNQSFNVGKGPIVAILPAGSNMTATWPLSGKGQPTIALSPFIPSTQSSIIVPVIVPVIESTSTPASTPASTAASTMIFGTTMVDIPVILPVGIVDTVDQQNFVAQGLNANVITSLPVVTQPEIVQQNHRFEFQLIDFQWNNSLNSVNTDINQDIMLSVKITAESLAVPSVVAQNITLSDMTPVVLNRAPIQETFSGLQQVFNGTYLTSLSNKIQVARTITQDLCGQIPNRALLTVVVAPLTAAADLSSFQQQSYTCVINLINFPTAARSTESFWSDIMQCNSGLISGYSFRLWYKVRQYNIDWSDCQQNRTFPIFVNA